MDSRILQEAALSYLAVYNEELREEMEDCGMILSEDYYPVYEDTDALGSGYGKGVDTDPLAKLTPNNFLAWQARNPSRRPKPDTRLPRNLYPTPTSANVRDITHRRGNPKAKSLPQEGDSPNSKKPKIVKVDGKWTKQMESLDYFDVVLHHLISEGYADSVDSAEVIMANMSEDWIENIIEAKVDKGKSKKDKIESRNLRNLDPDQRTSHPSTDADFRRYLHKRSRGE